MRSLPASIDGDIDKVKKWNETISSSIYANDTHAYIYHGPNICPTDVLVLADISPGMNSLQFVVENPLHLPNGTIESLSISLSGILK